jgi:hypothetical protein
MPGKNIKSVEGMSRDTYALSLVFRFRHVQRCIHFITVYVFLEIHRE